LQTYYEFGSPSMKTTSTSPAIDMGDFAADDDEDEARLPIIIWDQFEELFTTHQDRWQDAEGFFLQVREALDTIRELGVIFVMREDHIAAVEPYAPPMPPWLRARFRMERLRYEGALAAVTQPAARAGYAFAPGVAERLVNNLRRIRTPSSVPSDGAPPLGPYIEPVQLQVVCSRLWDNLPERAGEPALASKQIQWADVEQFGNIDQALTDFYERAVVQACAHAEVSERQVRRWFGQQLITPMETRGLVMRGEGDTGGLPNRAVDILEDQHIIRAESRAGTRWYELCHDRFVAPVLESNAVWEAARETPLRAAARRWQATEDASLLYRDVALQEAQDWLGTHANDAEPYEIAFIEASVEAERTRERQRRLRTTITAIAGLIAIIMGFLARLAYQGQVRAEEQTRIALSRQLAAQAQNEQYSNNPDLALLLAIEAVRVEDTLEALSALRIVLAQPQGTIHLLQHDTSVSHARWDHAEARIVTFDTSGQGWIWDAATGERLHALDGSTTSILEAAWSPDDEYVAAVSMDGTARVWAAATGDLVLETQAHQGYAYTLAWSPDSDRVATTGGDALARVWDIATGETVMTLEGHAATISVITWHPMDDQILTTSWDGTAALWDAEAGTRVLTFTGHTDAIQSAAWSPEGTRVLSAGRDTIARIWDTETGAETVALKGHMGQIRHAVWNHAGTQVLTMGDDKTARVWDAETGEALFMLLGHTDRLFTGGWSPDDGYILTAGWDGLPRVWDAATGREVVTLIGHTRRIAHATWNAAGDRILTDSSDHTARIWDVVRAQQPAGELPVIAPGAQINAAQWRGDGTPDGAQILLAGKAGVAGLWDQHANLILEFAVGRANVQDATWNHAGDAIAMADDGGGLRVFDAQRGAQIISVTGHTDRVLHVAWSPDDARLLSAGSDATARIWDVDAAEIGGHAEVAVLTHGGQVNCAAWHPEGYRILTCSEDGTAALWDAATGDRQLTFEAHGASVTSGRWNAAGDRLLTTSMDKTAMVWDAETGEVLWVLEGHTGWLNHAVWNADESLILTAATDGTARIWDAQTGKLLRVLEGHAGEVTLAHWNTEESLILTASKDGTVRVWDAHTENGGTLAVLYGHTGSVIMADWNSTQTRVLTVSEDGTARQFYMQRDDLLTAACTRTLPQMTLEEWQQIMKDRGEYRPTCQ
jgi:WD40 repeat protein